MTFEEIKLYSQIAGIVLIIIFYLIAYILKRNGDDLHVNGWIFGAFIIGILLPISIIL